MSAADTAGWFVLAVVLAMFAGLAHHLMNDDRWDDP